MACRCDGYEDPNKHSREMREELDRVTDMLCWVLARLKDRVWLREDVLHWWKAHQEADRERAQRELEKRSSEVRSAELRIKAAQEDLETAKRVLAELKSKTA